MAQGPDKLTAMPPCLAGPALTLLLVLPWIQPLSAGPWRNAWPWLISAACLAALLLLRRHWRPQTVARAWLLAALIGSLMALLQYLGWSADWSPWVAPIGPGEGAGNLRQRNQFASLTAIGLIGLIYLAAGPPRARPSPSPQAMRWAWALPALLLLAAGHAVTSSRTGLLAWVLVLLGCLWFRSGRQAISLAALGLLLYGCASALMPMALEWALAAQGGASPCAGRPCNAIERMASAGSDSRLTLWHNVIALIAERPWSGWGWNELGYAHYITLFEGPRFTEKLDNAHNLPLHLAVELGLPLTLLMGATLLGLLWRARPWAETRPWRQAAWGVLVVIGLHSLLEYPLWYGPFQVTVLVCVIGLAWRPRSAIASPTPMGSPGPDRWIDALALGLMLGVAVIAFDYHRTSQVYLPTHQRHSVYRNEPLQAAQASWFFQNHARFATLTLTPLRADNAAEQLALAQEMLHHSAEPVVIERLLDSAVLLGHHELLAFHSRRYEAAYPQAHAKWLQRQSTAPGPTSRP
jgi:O-antigen ligase